MKNDFETEHFYDILKNDKGALLFCIRTRDGEPETPKILYSGGDHALFYRRPDQTIVLDYVHPDIRPALNEVPQALVAEFSPTNDPEAIPSPDKQGILREYMAEVSHVSELPVDLTNI